MSLQPPTVSRSRFSNFLGELKRRKVFNVGVVYTIVGLGAAQAADVFLGNLGPPWVLQAALIVLLVGFPLSLLLAWWYDLTPLGLLRDHEVAASVGGASTEVTAEVLERVQVPTEKDPRFVAVLPFANLSDNPQNEYFVDGITDDILTALTLIEGLKVTSRTSAMHFKGSKLETRAVAAELGVGTVVKGSVRRMGDRIRVVVQLIQVTTDVHLWAETFDRELKDVFEVQSEVARNVARALRSQLSPVGQSRMAIVPTQNVRAYELVARARHAYLKVTPDHVEYGMKLLREAIDLDPEYAVAWAHLAIAHFVLPYFSTVAPSSIRDSAREAIDRALELDDGLSEAYVARGCWLYNFRHDWERSERDFGRALEINPSSADAYQWRGLMHLLCRRNEQAIEDAKQSVALDPLSFQTRSQLAQNLIWGGRPEEAKPILEEIIEEDPSNFISQWALGIVLRATDGEAAVRHFDAGLEHMDVPLGQASKGLTLRMLGRSDEADAILAALERRAAGDEYVSPFTLAVSRFGRGEVERGFDHLEEGIDDYDFLSLYIRIIAPAFGLQEHPRYEPLCARVWPNEFPTDAG